MSEKIKDFIFNKCLEEEDPKKRKKLEDINEDKQTKITAMLIDQDLFELQEIVDMLIRDLETNGNYF